MIHLDTSFVVDLLREAKRSGTGRAHTFIERLDEDEVLALSVHVAGELLAGAELSRRPAQEAEQVYRLLEGLEIRYANEGFAPAYGRLYAALQKNGRSVGAMDLLIATAAVLDNASLVTGNVKEFQRVPGLRVVQY